MIRAHTTWRTLKKTVRGLLPLTILWIAEMNIIVAEVNLPRLTLAKWHVGPMMKFYLLPSSALLVLNSTTRISSINPLPASARLRTTRHPLRSHERSVRRRAIRCDVVILRHSTLRPLSWVLQRFRWPQREIGHRNKKWVSHRFLAAIVFQFGYADVGYLANIDNSGSTSSI